MKSQNQESFSTNITTTTISNQQIRERDSDQEVSPEHTRGEVIPREFHPWYAQLNATKEAKDSFPVPSLTDTDDSDEED